MARTYGTSTYFDLGTGADLGSGSPWSLAGWFILKQAFPGVIIAKENSAITSIQYRIYVNGFRIFVSLTHSGTYQEDQILSDFSDTVWTHVVVACDSGGWSGYFNGVAKSVSGSTTNYTTETGAGSLPVFMGANQGPANYFNGAVCADVGLWNVRLTDAEAAALASGTLPYQVRAPKFWWPLDGLQSPEPDLGGLANNATLVGSISSSFGPPAGMFTPKWPQFPLPLPPTLFLMPQIVT